MKNDLYYLRGVSLNSIRDCILDNNISAGSTILLNSRDFDNMVLEYRGRFDSSMTFPSSITGVLLEEDKSGDVPMGRIKVKNESETDVSLERRNILSTLFKRELKKKS